MKYIPFTEKEMSPLLQLLILIGYAVAGSIVFGVIAILIVVGLFGMGFFNEILSGVPTSQSADAFKILLLLSTSVGTFLAPSIALAWTEKQRVAQFYGLKKPDLKGLLLVFLVIMVCTPALQWVVELNQRMDLPDAFKGVEEWMRASEEQAMQTTYTLLAIRNWWDLPVNLFVVAVMPGIAEEFMFRGGLQRTFGRILANKHVTIWFTAAVFSAIHMQFLGFFPRLFLGAGLGYIYLWTGSLWYPIFGHFVNNAYGVLVAYYYSMRNIPLEQANKEEGFHWTIYLISALLTAVTMTAIYRMTKRIENDEQLG